MGSQLLKLWRDEAGVATVEYALLVMLVVVAGMVGWQSLSGAMRRQLSQVSSSLATPLN